MFPSRDWVFPFIAKENPMCPVVSIRVLRPVPTLLGGSGRACASPPQRRDLPALLKHPVAATAPVGIPC